MRTITKHILTFLFFIPSLWLGTEGEIYAQNSSTFMRTFNAAGMNGGLSLATTSDGGFVGTGQHGTSGAGSCDVYVYKVDACGEPEWFKVYGGTGEDGGYSIEQTSDGGYIVAGLAHFGAGDYDILLLKLDALGIIEWSKVYGGGASDHGLRAKQTADGGYILSGHLTGLGFGAEDIALIKTDALGNTLWIKIYGGAGSEWGNYVEQTNDGGYLVLGYTTSFGAGGFDIYMIKVDSVGSLEWTKTYGGPGGEASSQWGISGKITTDGGFMLCANTSSWGAGSNDLLMIKTDSIGNLQWAKAYGGAGDDQPRFAEQTTDGGYILSGYTTSFGAGSLDAYLVKTDSAGNLQWSNAYGGAGSDRGSMVRQTDDGGYAMSTVTSSFGANYFDALFMKTDSVGAVGCYENACATVVTNVTPTVGTGGNQMIPAAVITVPAITTTDYTPADDFICKHCVTVPSFTPSDTIVCVGDTVYFYNTTSVGIRCFEDWYINGTVVNGDKDTLPFVFNTSGTQVIQLIAACGNVTDTNTINIHVYDFPVAAFSNTSVCNGTATQFTDNSTIPTGTISGWIWDFGDGSPLNNNQTITGGHTYDSAGFSNVTLIVANSAGCADTITKPVEVYYNPIADFTYSNVCLGDTMYFNNTSSVDTSASISTYLWVFGDGTATSSLQNPAHKYAASGTFNVTLVTTTTDLCTDAANFSVKVFDPPSAIFALDNTCLFDSALITNTSLNPVMGTLASWSWNFGDGTPLNSTVWSPSHLYATPGNYQVTLITLSSNLGCPDTLKDSITVYPMPVANFGFMDVCLNQAMNFNDSSIVASGSITGWSWNFGDGSPLNILEEPSHIYANTGTYIVTVIVTTNNGCKDTISKSVVVHPLPVAQYSTTNVCDGTIVQFTDLSSIAPSDTIQSWKWNFGDASPFSTNGSTSHLYTGPGSYPVELLIISTFGCSDSITKTSVINPNPIVSFVGNDTIGCEPLCISFQNSSTVITGYNALWLWDFGDGSPTSNLENVQHCYISDSIFSPYPLSVSLQVTSDSGCVTIASKSNYVIVYPNPVANFIVQPEVTTIVDPVISIIDASTGTNFWSWNFGDLDTASLYNPLPHTYADTGTYIITLITSTQYNCLDTAYQTIIIEPDFVFYIPNSFSPNDDGINDTFSGKGIFIRKYEMRIFDRWGNLIFVSDDVDKAWDGKANHGAGIAEGDVYIYSINIVDYKKGKHSYKGIVTLVR